MKISLNTKIKKYELEIEGGKFQAELLPMSIKDYQNMIRFLKNPAFETESEERKGIAATTDNQLAELINEYFPKYCKSVEGIEIEEDEESRVCTIDDLMTHGGLLNISFVILMKIWEISTLKDTEVKNIKK